MPHAPASKLYHPPFYIPLGQYLFEVVWALLCYWTPKPFNFWRLIILRLFGCRISGAPFVHSRARITHPWNLTLHHLACLGDRSHAYALGPITLHPGCTVAQEAYLCSATHQFDNASMPLITAPVVIAENAFIGARAFVLPGVTIGAHSIIGACAVVTRSVPAQSTAAGTPAKIIPRSHGHSA